MSGEHNAKVTFDKTDLSSRGVMGFLIGLAITVVLIHLVLWGAYKYMSRSEIRPAPTENPIRTSNQQMQRAGGDPQVQFPAPRLQADPVADMNRFRVREDEHLSTYGPAGEGRARIPIEQAMEIVAHTGLPTRPAQLAKASGTGIKP